MKKNFSNYLLNFFLILCFTLSIISVYKAMSWNGKIFPGFLLYNPVIVSDVVLPHWAQNQGFNLQSYDKIVEVNGIEVSNSLEVYDIVQTYPADTIIKYSILRNNNAFEVDIPSYTFTFYDIFNTFGIEFIVGFIFLFIGTVVYLVKPLLLNSKIFLCFCMSLSMWFILDIDYQTTFSLFYNFNWSLIAQNLTAAFLIIFAFVFPSPKKIFFKYKNLFFIPFLITFGLILYQQYALRNNLYNSWELIILFSYVYVFVGTIFVLTSLILTNFNPSSILDKQRSRVVLIGALFGFLIPAILAILVVFFKFANLIYIALPLLIFPLSIGYAIVKHKLFDIHVLIQKTLVYGLSTVAVASLFIISFFGFNILFTSENSLNNPTYLLLISTIVVIAVNPLKNLVQRFVDSMFFRTRYDYASTISEFSDSLSSLLNVKEISHLLTYTVQKSLYVENGYLFIINSESGVYKPVSSIPPGKFKNLDYEFNSNETLVEFLYKNKKEIFVEDVISEEQYAMKRIDLLKSFADLNASIIFPLLFKSDLLGIFVLGTKKSGQAYTTDDINFIRTMTTQAAIAIENSFSFGLVQDYADELEEKNIQLKDVQTQLIQAEKMSAIGHLASGLAHEIRNPLNIIEGARYYLSTIFSNGSENRIAHEYLEYIQNEVVRTNRLIDSLLDFSKYQQSNIENINVNNVIENVLILSRKQLSDSNIKLIKNLNENLPTLKGDSNQLWQVVINLLMNSIQAINSVHSGTEDGEIVIETGKYNKEDMTNGQHLYLKFMDNGCGIKSSDLSSIFDPFFTKKPDGTGLGLSVSYKIIEAHSGSFFVSSEVGIGTSFMVELPLINNFTGEVVSNGSEENINS